MLPSKLEKNSRCSSILKLPKLHQPAEPNDSPGIDSPMKLKRRVSFAEKKHVKEFCDSIEQGTVWDNTYEESDSSHTRINPPPYIDDNSGIPVLSELTNALNCQPSSLTVDDTSNLLLHHHHQSRKVLIRQNAIDLDYFPVEALHNRFERGDINQVIISANPELLANKENIPAVLKLSRVESSLIDDETSVRPRQSFRDETQVFNNKSMEITEAVSSVWQRQTSEDMTEVFTNESMDMTQPVPSICSGILSNNEVQTSSNDTVELIEPTVSVLIPRSPEQFSKDKTQYFHNTSMEMTGPVIQSQFLSHEVQQNKSELSKSISNTSNCTEIYDNYCMEHTEVIPSLERQYQQISNENKRINTEFTSPNPKNSRDNFLTQGGQVSEKDRQALHRLLHRNLNESAAKLNTSSVHDRSIEINISPHFKQSENSIQQNLSTQNVSMEMTEVIPSVFNNENSKSENLNDFRTQVFHNESMEMTEAVSAVWQRQTSEDMTRVFNNESMQMTEPVPSIRSEILSNNEIQTSSNDSELIEPTVSVLIPRSPEQFSKDKTQYFHNTSMEMTGPVIQSQFLSHEVQQNKSELSKSISNTSNCTEIYDNYCMEHTEMIPSLKRQYQQISNENIRINTEFTSPNPKNSRDNFFTQGGQVSEEDRQALHRILHRNLNESAAKLNTSSVHDRSTEINISPHFKQSENSIQQNLSTQNVSMEMTEVIPSVFNNENSESKNPNDFIEQLRFRASSSLNLPNEDLTSNIAISIRQGIVNENFINAVEDVEVPSFVFANISNETPLSDVEEPDDIVPTPNISITEVFNPLDDCHETFVPSMNIENSEKSHKKPNESINDLTNECVTASDKTFCQKSSPNTIKRIYIGAISDEKVDATLGKTKNIECVTLTPELSVHEVQNEISVNVDVKDDSIINESSSLSEMMNDTKALKSDINEVWNNLPIKKIYSEHPILVEHDLIMEQIKNNLKAAAVAKKKIMEQSENILEVNNEAPVSTELREEVIESRYDILIHQLNEKAKRDDCIWELKSTTPKIIAIEYCMTGLILGIVFDLSESPNDLEKINRICIVPRLADEEKPILRMTDMLVVETIDVKSLMQNYKTYDDILKLIEDVTKDIDNIFSFYHELKFLSRINTMEVYVDRVLFDVWSENRSIILNISMNIKNFKDIEPNDIDVKCLLGSVRINDVKALINNIVNRNYKFLTIYINDVKNYLSLMEETMNVIK